MWLPQNGRKKAVREPHLWTITIIISDSCQFGCLIFIIHWIEHWDMQIPIDTHLFTMHITDSDCRRTKMKGVTSDFWTVSKVRVLSTVCTMYVHLFPSLIVNIMFIKMVECVFKTREKSNRKPLTIYNLNIYKKSDWRVFETKN